MPPIGVGVEDIYWAKPGLFVISKGTRLRELVPISPDACVRLAHYLDIVGSLPAGESIWRTRRGVDRPLSYWAMRQVLQRAQTREGTDWTLHDLRHTAASRMTNGGTLTLAEVQAVLRHANIQTTMPARLEELEADLLLRRARAETDGWIGEMEGIDLTLSFLRSKRDETQRRARRPAVVLGMPRPRSAKGDQT